MFNIISFRVHIVYIRLQNTPRSLLLKKYNTIDWSNVPHQFFNLSKAEWGQKHMISCCGGR